MGALRGRRGLQVVRCATIGPSAERQAFREQAVREQVLRAAGARAQRGAPGAALSAETTWPLGDGPVLRVALSAWGEEAAPREMFASSPHAAGGAPASPGRDAEAAGKAERKAQKKAHKEAKRLKKERKELKKLRSRSADSAGAFGGGLTSGDEALPAEAQAEMLRNAPKPVPIPAAAVAPARQQVAASAKVTTTIPGGNGKPTELVVEVKTGENSVWLLVLRCLIGFAVFVLVFVFLSIVVRTSQRTTVTSEGWLMAYSDPWGVNTVPQNQEPLKTVQLENTLGSLLNVHTAPLESIHKLHTLRFAVMQDNDWVAYVENVERIVRPMSGSTTTISFASGDSLVIDSAAQPPLQAVFYSDNVAYQVMVPDRFGGSGAAGACVECPDNMHTDGPSCACDEGFTFARDTFRCVPARRRALQAAEDGGAVEGAAVATSTPLNTQISTGACIANITYANVLVGSTLSTLVFKSPRNAWGSAVNLTTGLQSNTYSGTPLPKCAKSWTYTDDQGTQKNVPMSGCASLVNFMPKSAAFMQADIKKVTDSNTAFKDIYWCPREDLPDYHKMFFGTGPVKDIDLLWGFCTPCPTPVPTTIAPSSKPTAPTAPKPTLKPTTPRPTLKPTTPKPTGKPTTGKPTTGKPTSKPTTSKPTAPTTRAPSTQPTAAPTTLAPSNKPTTAKPTGKPTTLKPTTTRSPSKAPTTSKPSAAPSQPTPAPTRNPTKAGETFSPSAAPTAEPTAEPTTKPPTEPPSQEPTEGEATEAPSASTCISSHCQNAEIAFDASKDFCEAFAERRLCSVSELRNIRDRFLSLYNSQDTTMKEAAFAEGSYFQCFRGGDAADDVMKTMLWADGDDCQDGSRYAFMVGSGTAECVDATDSSLRTVCCPSDPSPETQAEAKKRAKTEITSQVSVNGAAATVAAKKNTLQALRGQP